MKWVDYREKLGVGFNDDKKLGMCKNRIRNFLPELNIYYGADNLRRYANITGERYSKLSDFDYHPLQCAAADIYSSDSLLDFLSRYIALIQSCTVPEREKGIDDLLEELLCTTLDQYSIQHEIIRDQDGIFVFPKGVEEFDKELVSNTLLWLADYPETERAWSNALKKYAENAAPSEVADDFRKALERFFQNFFESKKSLENLKSEYGIYLRDNGVPAGIAGNLETVLQQYMNINNDNAKHHENVSKNILEYLMYQTGNIIRLLITLKQS